MPSNRGKKVGKTKREERMKDPRLFTNSRGSALMKNKSPYDSTSAITSYPGGLKEVYYIAEQSRKTRRTNNRADSNLFVGLNKYLTNIVVIFIPILTG